MKHKIKAAAGLLCAAALLTGCGSSAGTFAPAQTAVAGTVTYQQSGTLTAGQQQSIADYMAAYYDALGNLSAETPAGLFANEDITAWESAVWSSTVAVRQSALEDLHLSAYTVSLEVTAVSDTEDGVQVSVTEDNTQQFCGLDVLTEQYDVFHTFWLAETGEDAWAISDHDCDSGTFYSFSYDSVTGTDTQLSEVLANVRQRHAMQGVETSEEAVLCDHAYDRDAALSYMMTWIETRNPAYDAYDEWGGNCMNYASQVLAAGGIPMDGNWYWDSGAVTDAWCNVGSFTDYAEGDRGAGLVCQSGAPYYTGQVGDLLLMGISDGRNHATEICGLVTDAGGNTVDYLLCSNTANLRNFPAGAYYYTNQNLVRIYGWND